ncbi:MAG: glycosyltransferase family 2 protein [Desulfomicrobium sp.]|nr:glycosyltransferase family 2 protein [Pseudomonadota bacterium]MBV1712998.1 glycosyltransferase family 2 protein [Desulfomicrobium sp.]MBU4571968.1 glycosyltransferase family 2 protein [Pseudomonadota bacterium]MBU4596117.1 glycosyltransferase family 2 protein [Pseudomonadota bacterium]MBV1721421.1 glycosyltransferase family 2 protein [Desulfomicrobium sp.]
MHKANVSVVIPCFNSEATILRALDSVLQQTLVPNEIVIVDDGSSDSTESIVSFFLHSNSLINIRYFRLSVNSGPSKARNIGWNYSISKYVAFLDADDTWHPKKIEIQYEFMEQNSYVDICGHASGLFKDEIDEVSGKKDFFLFFLHHLLIKNRFSTPSVIIKREISFRFNETMRYSEDYNLWLNLAASGHFLAFIPETLCYLHKERYGEAGLSSNLIHMWLGEISSFFELWKKNSISLLVLCFFCAFSFLKLAKRFFCNKILRFFILNKFKKIIYLNS